MQWQCYLFRNEEPNLLSGVKGFWASMTRAWPGTTWCPSPWDTTINLSVVGSGPTRMPGKSDLSRCLMSEDFPVEYWPTTSTWGRTSKSTSDRDGLWKLWKLYIFSRGSNLFLKHMFRCVYQSSKNSNHTYKHPSVHPPLLTYCSLSATNWTYKIMTAYWWNLWENYKIMTVYWWNRAFL